MVENPSCNRGCKSVLAVAGHGDGHVLTVAVALLLAILTGRSDLCIAGVFSELEKLAH